jgi:hypothetical protein
MEFLQDIKDSVETAVSMKLFASQKESSYAHIFHSTFESITISQCRDMDNFNPARLSKDPYPEDDRPRGEKDLASVLFHRRAIRKYGHTEPIWIAFKKGRYILLDGAHRIVAAYLENKRSIPTYIVNED